MERYIDATRLQEELDGTFIGRNPRIVLNRIIEEQPNADVVKHIKAVWIPIHKGERGYSAGDFKCSYCGQPNKCYIVTAFCCNCGADMRGGKNEN